MHQIELDQDLQKAGVAVKTDVRSPPERGTLVWAGARAASTALAELIDDDRVIAIGTRLRGGRLYEATQSGFWAAAGL